MIFADGWFYVVGESVAPNTTLGIVLRSQDGKHWQTLAQLQPADDQTTCENRCIIYDYQIVKLPKPLN